MTIALPRYTVLVADPDHPDDPDHAVEHTVTIRHADQLRAELEGPRNAIPGMDVAPMHGITLWIWAALVRTGAVDDPFQAFLPRMLGFADAGADTGALPGQVATPADPTRPTAASGSPSSSPSISATFPGGWTASTPTPTG